MRLKRALEHLWKIPLRLHHLRTRSHVKRWMKCWIHTQKSVLKMWWLRLHIPLLRLPSWKQLLILLLQSDPLPCLRIRSLIKRKSSHLFLLYEHFRTLPGHDFPKTRAGLFHLPSIDYRRRRHLSPVQIQHVPSPDPPFGYLYIPPHHGVRVCTYLPFHQLGPSPSFRTETLDMGESLVQGVNGKGFEFWDGGGVGFGEIEEEMSVLIH